MITIALRSHQHYRRLLSKLTSRFVDTSAIAITPIARVVEWSAQRKQRPHISTPLSVTLPWLRHRQTEASMFLSGSVGRRPRCTTRYAKGEKVATSIRACAIECVSERQYGVKVRDWKNSEQCFYGVIGIVWVHVINVWVCEGGECTCAVNVNGCACKNMCAWIC